MVSFPVSGLAAEPIKLGVTEPLSGTFKNIGERYLEGVQYAAKVLNQQGGVLGRKIEVIPIDSELKPDVATRKATALILKDQVKYFCGGTGSSVGAAMSTVAEQNNAIMFTYGMDAASLTGQKCSKNFFRPGTNTDMHSYALAAYVAKSKFKKVYCIGQDYSFGYESIKPFISRLKKLNPSIEIVAEVYHPLGEKDYGPYVSRIVASGADLVFTTELGQRSHSPRQTGQTLRIKGQVCRLLPERRRDRLRHRRERVTRGEHRKRNLHGHHPHGREQEIHRGIL